MHVCGLSQFQNSKSEATSHEVVRAGTLKKVVSKVGYELHYPTTTCHRLKQVKKIEC